MAVLPSARSTLITGGLLAPYDGNGTALSVSRCATTISMLMVCCRLTCANCTVNSPVP